jgi:hypothetical protein
MTSAYDTTQLARNERLVSWLSLAWMTTEGVVGVIAGIGTNSIALLGYGLDSTIQGMASLVIIWRFTGSRIDSEQAERLAQKIVAVTFFLLAATSVLKPSAARSPASRPRVRNAATASSSSRAITLTCERDSRLIPNDSIRRSIRRVETPSR